MKSKYRIRNWNDYNKSLIQRGSITVWFSDDAIKKWIAPKEAGKKGRPKIYSDNTILTALIIRSVFHLPLRALQGFLASLVIILTVGLSVPSYNPMMMRNISLLEILGLGGDNDARKLWKKLIISKTKELKQGQNVKH